MKKIMLVLVAASVGYLYQQSIIRSAAQTVPNDEQVIRVSAARFEFQPSEITVKKGAPVILEITSRDRHHGFKLAAFQLRADIQPGAVQKLRFVPDKTGTFSFFCHVFCGDGHEDMSGTLKVVD